MPTTAYTMAGEWDDSQAPALSLRVGGTAPTFDALVGSVWTYFFASGEEMHGSIQLSHKYIPGSALRPHVHFTFKTAPTVGETVEWGLELIAADVFATFPGASTTTTALYTITASNQLKHILLSLPEISGTGLDRSSILLFRLFRSGGSSSVEPALLSFDMHFQQGSYGTETEY